MRDNYSKQNLIVVTIVAGALALVIGFAAGALLTMPDRQKMQAVVGDVQAELKDSITAGNKQIAVSKTEVEPLKSRLRGLTRELEQSKNEKIILLSRIEKLQKQKINPAFESITAVQPLEVGETGVIDQWTVVAVDRESHNQQLKARLADDKKGYVELFVADKIFIVNQHVKALVIDKGSILRKIRILEGEQQGQIGWISYAEIFRVKETSG